MKKVFAIALAAIMLTLAVSAVHEPDDTTIFWRDDKTNVAHSFDTVFYDDKSQMDLGFGADGHAENIITKHPIVVGENVQNAITIRGWAGIKQDKYEDVHVAEVGYVLNEDPSTYTKSGDLYESEDIVPFYGEYRFDNLVINVAGITDPTLITIVAKGTDGKLYDFGEFSINGKYVAANNQPADTTDTTDNNTTNPPTADASVIAIAAVACIALAGVVVAKKAK